MKKFFKKAVSVILTFITIFAVCPSVFATDSYVSDETVYEYYGELTLGWNNVWEDNNLVDGTYCIDDLYVYYSFSVPESGYYCLHYGTPHTEMNADIDGAIYFNKRNPFDYSTKKLFYLEKGNYKLLIDVYCSVVDVNFYFDFLGESVTDISFNHDLLLDCDFYYSYDSFDNKHYINTEADAAITFSSGKIYDFENGSLFGTMKNSPVEGSNDMIIDFHNRSFNVTANVHSVSHYIKDVEISNIENYYSNVLKYYNDVKPDFPYGEEVTITFKDGTTQSFEYNYTYLTVTMPNGQDYPFDILFDYDPYSDSFEDGACLYLVTIGYATVKEYRFDGKPASFTENLNSLKEQYDYCLSEFTYYLKEAVGSFGNPQKSVMCFAECALCVLNMLIEFCVFFCYYTMFRFL